MNILSLENVSKTYGIRPLFEKRGWKPLRIRPWNEGDTTPPPTQPRVLTIATSPKAPA